MKTRKLFLIATIFLFASAVWGAELLVTPQEDVDPNATGHYISINGSPRTFVPIKLTPHAECNGNCVILVDLTQIQDGTTIELWATNEQGRISDADPNVEGDQPTPFVLSPKPSASTNYRIIRE